MSDGDPNDKTENPFDGLSFSPDWAKGDADSHYANLHRYAARFEDRDDRGDRRLVGVLPDGPAFHQLEAGIPDAGKRLL